MLTVSRSKNVMGLTRRLLGVDSFINLLLGGLLVFFPVPLAEFLGIPVPKSAFYPSVLGGVLFGIGIALGIEYWQPRERLGGLGLGAAIAINLCGGLVLSTWLLRGAIVIPMRGYVFLWCIALGLIGLGTVELVVRIRTWGGRPTKRGGNVPSP